MAEKRRISEEQALEYLPKDLDWRKVDAGWLAKSILLSQLNPRFEAFRQQLHAYLVAITAQHAFEHSPFYSRRFKSLEPMLYGREPFEISRIEPLTRADVEGGVADLPIASADLFPSYTSGTTTGRSMMLLHSEAGRRAMQESMELLTSLLAPTEQNPSDFILKLAFQAYGHAADRNVLPVISKLNAGMEKAVDLLNPNTDNPGGAQISKISGGPYDIVDLTLVAMDRFGRDFERAAAPISELHTTGTFVSKHLRDWLEGTWEAKLYDTLSFSEVPIYATSCVECGHYHFHPICHVETLSHTGEVLDEGRGRLVMTPLYPTVQTTHLIRYEVGDYVQKLRVNCPKGLFGYRFLGRYQGSVSLSPEQSTESFLGIAEMIDILDDLPDVARPVFRHNVGYDSKLRDVKHWPRFRMTNDDGKLALVIRLTYPPAAFPARVSELGELVRNRISHQMPWLRDVFDATKVRIDFAPPDGKVL